MANRFKLCSALLGAAALATITDAAAVQVVVGEGQTLTREDLLAGEFNGVSFTLGPELVIDVLAGGTIGVLNPPGFPSHFQFHGATVNIHAGGQIEGGPVFDDYDWYHFVRSWNLNIMVGAEIGSRLQSSSGIITMHGGSIGDGLYVVDGLFHTGNFLMLGGSIGKSAAIFSTFELVDGAVGDDLVKSGLNPFEMSGGSVGDNFHLTGPAHQSGGSIGNSLVIGAYEAIWGGSGHLIISGGSIGNGLSVGGFLGDEGVLVSGQLTLHVTELSLDNAPVELTPNEPMLVTQRGRILLEATLADGSPFDLTLNAIPVEGQDYISEYALLHVIRVPSHNECVADVSGDGMVDLNDLNLVLTWFGHETDAGDADGNGVVDLDDLNIVLTAFGSVCG